MWVESWGGGQLTSLEDARSHGLGIGLGVGRAVVLAADVIWAGRYLGWRDGGGGGGVNGRPGWIDRQGEGSAGGGAL